MRIFLGFLLFFIIIFIFCCCRVAHEADEDDIKYFDRYGLCFKAIQTSREKTIFMNTRKATFNSVKEEDVAELDNNEFTMVNIDEFNEKTQFLLENAVGKYLIEQDINEDTIQENN